MTSRKVIFHYENCSFAKVIKFYDWFIRTQERDWKEVIEYEDWEVRWYIDNNRKGDAIIVWYFKK